MDDDLQIVPLGTVRPAANNPAARRRAARKAAAAATPPVLATPSTDDVVDVSEAPPAKEELPPDPEALAAVLGDAPAAYLSHILALAGGDVMSAVSLHFESNGGIVPPEFLAKPTAPPIHARPAANATPPPRRRTARPETIERHMGEWEREDASWHLAELPPAHAWAPTSSEGVDTRPVLVWVRAGDLRLTDNPALWRASMSGAPVIPVYIEPTASEQRGWPVQGAAAYWLNGSLNQLQHALKRLGSALVIRAASDSAGDSVAALLALAQETRARLVLFNAGYEPWRVTLDERAREYLRSASVPCERLMGNVLYEPWDARCDERSTSAGFGSVGFFLSAVKDLPEPAEPLPPPTALRVPTAWPRSLPLSALRLARLPVRADGTVVDWAVGLRSSWVCGEAGGRAALDAFVSHGVRSFESRERFRADEQHTAAISPYLRFGELSARTVRAVVRRALGEKRAPTFERRLAWRDLAIWSLWRFPDLADEPFRKHYASQKWTGDSGRVDTWRKARTGFPLVDAALTQLWRTGWMPNYMRHVVAGFLVEFLNADWRHGERWFHDTLVDADLAINAFMWQNGGHSGFDQWNFVMHPVFAAKACDPEGEYVRMWLPQLSKLPVEYIHCPWEAPFGLRCSARLVLASDSRGEIGTYASRVLTDLEAARKASHGAVMAVRRGVGKRFVLPSGHEWYTLDSGVRVILITRQDYREGGVTREGVEITGDEILTRQTPEAKWDARRREKSDLLSVVIADCQSQQERAGGRARRPEASGPANAQQQQQQGGRRGAHSVTGLPRSKPSFRAR